MRAYSSHRQSNTVTQKQGDESSCGGKIDHIVNQQQRNPYFDFKEELWRTCHLSFTYFSSQSVKYIYNLSTFSAGKGILSIKPRHPLSSMWCRSDTIFWEGNGRIKCQSRRLGRSLTTFLMVNVASMTAPSTLCERSGKARSWAKGRQHTTVTTILLSSHLADHLRPP